MKTLLKLLLPVFMLTISSQSIAQQIDMERMNRDINIMENILQEMFKPETAFHTAGFSFDDKGIRGTYLPGYGIIFTIPDRSNGLVVFANDEDGNSSSGYRFKYSSGSESDKVSEESVINRISEFLGDYGSTIGQLSATDKVMVIYNTKPSHQVFTVISGDVGRNSGYNLPTISVAAKASDLQSYRSGDINREEFTRRLHISKTEAGDEGPMDLKVMATIFETAFEEEDEKSFRVTGPVDYLYLDNFGALFSFDAQYGVRGILSLNIGSVEAQLQILGERLEEIDKINTDSVTRKIIEISKNDAHKKALKERSEKLAEQKARVLEAYNQFKQRLKKYLVDYGRTLRSVAPNQHILVSVNIQSGVDEVPERVDFQLEKSVLEQLDEGDISREEAMKEIRVREY